MSDFFRWLALLLVIVGALNWMLVGIFEYDLVAEIFGDMATASRAVYIIVGLGGIYLIGDALVQLVAHPGSRKFTEIGQH
ncbi:MAG: DUF378 domain-containing protein [Thermoleophilia bacterium]